MNALGSLIVAEHLLDLRREAEVARRANAAHRSRPPAGPGPVQRLAGRSARRLSRGLAALAARVDPLEAGRQPTSSDQKRAIAA